MGKAYITSVIQLRYDYDMTKSVASMRQDEAIASSCFRRRQIFAHLFHEIVVTIQLQTLNSNNL